MRCRFKYVVLSFLSIVTFTCGAQSFVLEYEKLLSNNYPSTLDKILAFEKFGERAMEMGKIDTSGLCQYYIGRYHIRLGNDQLALSSALAANKFFNTSSYVGARKDRNLTVIAGLFSKLNKLDSALFYIEKVVYRKVKKNDSWIYSESAIDKADLYRKLGEFEASLAALEIIRKKGYYSNLDNSEKMQFLRNYAKSVSYAEIDSSNSLVKSIVNEMNQLSIDEQGFIYDLGEYSKSNIELINHQIRNKNYDEAIISLIDLQNVIYQNSKEDLNSELIKISITLAFCYEKLNQYDLMLEATEQSMTMEGGISVENDHARKSNFAMALGHNEFYEKSINFLDSAFLVLGEDRFNIDLNSNHKTTLIDLYKDEAKIHFLRKDEDGVKRAIKNLIALVNTHISNLVLEPSVLSYKEDLQDITKELMPIVSSLKDPQLLWELFEINKSSLILKDVYAGSKMVNTSTMDHLSKQKDSLAFENSIVEDSSIITKIAQLDQDIVKEMSKIRASQVTNDLATIQINDIQQKLNGDNHILQFQYTEDSLYSILISKGSTKMMSLGSTFEIKGDNQQILGQLTDPNATMDDRLIEEYCNKLFSSLEGLEGSIVIIPDEDLNFIPLDYLYNSTLGKDQNLTFSYAPSGSMWHHLKDADNKIDINHLYAPAYADGDFVDNRGEVGALQFNVDEITNIQESIGGKMFSRNEAQKDSFLLSMEEADILHFSGHAVLYPRDFKFSFLAFDKEIDSTYNVITSTEIARSGSNAKMVVLSACETGLGNVIPGEGVNNITRSFLQAGASSVIQTLWKVDDQSSSQIFASFYKYLKKGDAKSVALSKAKRDYLKIAPDFKKHPYYWAGIIVVGNDDPLQFEGDGWSVLYKLIVLGFVGFALYIGYKKVFNVIA